MMQSLFNLALTSNEPLFTSPAIERFKDLVNHLSKPEISLPIFTVLFVLMLVGYRKWTRPVIFFPLLGLFCVAYFGSMFIDHNYLLIIVKPDNVPITIMLLGVMLCLWVAFVNAAKNDNAIAAGKPLPVEGRDDKVLVWPDLVYTELIVLILATVALLAWSILLPAPLESPANPAGPPNPSKAPWYFLGLQEMLVYFDPWMAGVVLPTMIITGLISMPYIDVNPKGNGYYTLKERPFAISVWLFGFLILWVVLIVYGTFLRGPNWNFFGPYEYWDSHLQVPLTNINLSDYFWTYLLHQPLPENMFLRESVGIIFIGLFVLGGMFVLGNVFMRSLRARMGLLRFNILAIHLMIMGLLPLKMVLRWLFTLKYFIYLPELNLNL